MRVRVALEWGAILALGTLLAGFLLLPIAALFGTSSPSELVRSLGDARVWPALRLSLITSITSTAVVVGLGTPLSYALAQAPRKRLIESALALPIVVPPAVAGVALLLAFGRRGWLADVLFPATVSPAFSPAAVVMAQVFVACPFFVMAATSAFRELDQDVLLVARSLGASPLVVLSRVAIPLSARGLVAGAAMAWARALGEFGATLMFAGNMENRTQTLPLAIYATLEGDLRVARALSVLLVSVALGLLMAARTAGARWPQ
jgi:molybdate transport system permease protein